MCGGGAREASRAREQAKKDAAAMREVMQRNQDMMKRQLEKSRKETARNAPPPNSYRTKDPTQVSTVRRKKGNRAANVGATSLRIPLNTGGQGTGGGVNVG